MRRPRDLAIIVGLFLILAALASATPPDDGPVVRGRVHDPQGVPLAGVRVTDLESAQVAFTGLDGRFVLALSPRSSSATLSASRRAAARTGP